jgi:hypothetical protein
MFKKLANSSEIHLKNNVIKDLFYEDLKVYAWIRNIVCLDEIFVNTNYKNDDYISSKKQQI